MALFWKLAQVVIHHLLHVDLNADGLLTDTLYHGVKHGLQ